MGQALAELVQSGAIYYSGQDLAEEYRAIAALLKGTRREVVLQGRGQTHALKFITSDWVFGKVGRKDLFGRSRKETVSAIVGPLYRLLEKNRWSEAREAWVSAAARAQGIKGEIKGRKEETKSKRGVAEEGAP